MMQAEAYYRLGYPATALNFVNKIRQRAGLSDLAELDEEKLDAEWLHEFAYEGLRRTVNIRFGTWYKLGGTRRLIPRTSTLAFSPSRQRRGLKILTCNRILAIKSGSLNFN